MPKGGLFTKKETHHIIAKVDGGTDDEENLIKLCQICHSEWHSFEDGFSLPFSEWLKLPSGHNMILTLFAIKTTRFNDNSEPVGARILEDFELLGWV